MPAMRIIAGHAKGRKLSAPSSGTRPMTGRAREALFSSLADRLDGAAVLDLYAGSGSLGLEALSRGARSAVFVERSRSAARSLGQNVAAVGLGGDVVVGDVHRFVLTDRATYDLVFVDPPYDETGDAVDGLLASLAARLAEGATLVVHRRRGSRPPVVEFPNQGTRRRYGDVELFVFHRETPP